MTLLLLPGMNMNETIFGGLADRGLSLSFTDFFPGSDDYPDGLTGMAAYSARLNSYLESEPEWMQSEQRTVVAHSFGGMLALWWLIHEPSRLNRLDHLVLVATTAGPVYENASARIGFGRASIRIPISGLISLANRPTAIRMARRFAGAGSSRTRRVDFRGLRYRGDWWVGLKGWQNTDWRAIHCHRRTMSDFDVSGLLDRVHCPTTIIHGDRDSVLPPSVAEDLHRGITGSELVLMERAGHALPLTHWREVDRRINPPHHRS